MPEVCSLIWLALVGAFRSRVSLEAENMILRHQLNVLRRKSPKRPTFGMLDRLIFAGLYRLAPKLLGALAIVKPETVINWHRAGFRSYWRWKSLRQCLFTGVDRKSPVLGQTDANDRAPRGRELSVREGLTRIIVDWSGSWQAARPGNWLGRSPATKAALGCCAERFDGP